MSKLVKVELDLEKQLLHENQFSEALAFQKITLDSISIPREFDFTARVKDNYMLIEAPAFLGDPDSDSYEIETQPNERRIAHMMMQRNYLSQIELISFKDIYERSDELLSELAEELETYC